MSFPKNLFFFLLFTISSLSFGKKILLIGNSYTTQCSEQISNIFKKESGTWELSFLTKGGKDLAFHLANPETKKRIQSQKWDIVVLQEQSQKSGRGGHFSKSFHESVAGLSKIIRETGAIPYLYLTWGRKTGDQKNPEIYPDFPTMQKKISAAYFKAGKKNRAGILPVGLAYSKIKEQNQPLFESLYKKDGSHPSQVGAFLVSSVFWGVLTGKDPTTIKGNGSIEKTQAIQLRQAAKMAINQINQN